MLRTYLHFFSAFSSASVASAAIEQAQWSHTAIGSQPQVSSSTVAANAMAQAQAAGNMGTVTAASQAATLPTYDAKATTQQQQVRL